MLSGSEQWQIATDSGSICASNAMATAIPSGVHLDRDPPRQAPAPRQQAYIGQSLSKDFEASRVSLAPDRSGIMALPY
jgi:hypothetical protein